MMMPIWFSRKCHSHHLLFFFFFFPFASKTVQEHALGHPLYSTFECVFFPWGEGGHQTEAVLRVVVGWEKRMPKRNELELFSFFCVMSVLFLVAHPTFHG